MLRQDLYRTLSKVKVYVERNLGFEAEHHHRALGDIPGVEFYVVSQSVTISSYFAKKYTKESIQYSSRIVCAFLNERCQPQLMHGTTKNAAVNPMSGYNQSHKEVYSLQISTVAYSSDAINANKKNTCPHSSWSTSKLSIPCAVTHTTQAVLGIVF
jgi:hypothetical protein